MTATPFRASTTAIVIVVTSLSISCLIVTKHPLIDPIKSVPDKQLHGRWVGYSDEMEGVYALFDGTGSLETNILKSKEPTASSGSCLGWPPDELASINT